MGQKIHPTGFRLSVTRDWASRWFASKGNFAQMLHEDLKVREYLKKRLSHASVGRVIIERPAKNAPAMRSLRQARVPQLSSIRRRWGKRSNSAAVSILGRGLSVLMEVSGGRWLCECA